MKCSFQELFSKFANFRNCNLNESFVQSDRNLNESFHQFTKSRLDFRIMGFASASFDFARFCAKKYVSVSSRYHSTLYVKFSFWHAFFELRKLWKLQFKRKARSIWLKFQREFLSIMEISIRFRYHSTRQRKLRFVPILREEVRFGIIAVS
jgi:hypothetical protein